MWTGNFLFHSWNIIRSCTFSKPPTNLTANGVYYVSFMSIIVFQNTEGRKRSYFCFMCHIHLAEIKWADWRFWTGEPFGKLVNIESEDHKWFGCLDLCSFKLLWGAFLHCCPNLCEPTPICDFTAQLRIVYRANVTTCVKGSQPARWGS